MICKSTQQYFQIFTGNFPFLTKGPFALFYGGSAIIPLLSPSADNFPIAWTLSIFFHIFLIIFKKIKARKLTANQRLKEVVVTNFLNIFNNLLIFFACALLVLGAVLHYFIIKSNSKTDQERKPFKSPEDYWTNLAFLAFIETLFQFSIFLTNHAIRCILIFIPF